MHYRHNFKMYGKAIESNANYVLGFVSMNTRPMMPQSLSQAITGYYKTNLNGRELQSIGNRVWREVQFHTAVNPTTQEPHWTTSTILGQPDAQARIW